MEEHLLFAPLLWRDNGILIRPKSASFQRPARQRVASALDEEPAIHAATQGKIAVKVINHYGDAVLKVFKTPAG
jgi:hypothetical protein